MANQLLTKGTNEQDRAGFRRIVMEYRETHSINVTAAHFNRSRQEFCAHLQGAERQAVVVVSTPHRVLPENISKHLMHQGFIRYNNEMLSIQLMMLRCKMLSRNIRKIVRNILYNTFRFGILCAEGS